MVTYFVQTGTLHIPNPVLKERNGRNKTFRALLNFHNQNRILLSGINSRIIRFKRISSGNGFHRQLTQTDILIIETVGFHSEKI